VYILRSTAGSVYVGDGEDSFEVIWGSLTESVVGVGVA
jgi:hypothetical protein